MIESWGEVIAVQDGQARVRAFRPSGCHGCQQSAGCQTSVLTGFFKPRTIELQVPAANLAVGDPVLLSISPAALLRASAWIYLTPMLGLLLGAISCSAMLANETASLVGGFLGLVAGGWLARRVTARHGQHHLRVSAQPARMLNLRQQVDLDRPGE